jgi:uncharacterized protein YdaT
MPWTGPQFAAKHNHKLGKTAAASAARQASAMVRSGVDEGIAIATANKRANKVQRAHKRGLISDRVRDGMEQAASR